MCQHDNICKLNRQSHIEERQKRTYFTLNATILLLFASLFWPFCMLHSSTVSALESNTHFIEQLTQGSLHTPTLQLRLRAAYLNNTVFSDSLNATSQSGKATSARIKFHVHSNWTQNFSTTTEFEHIATGWKNFHSDGFRFNGEPTIPDTEATEVNQLYLQYRTPIISVKLGRQSINVDDERFISSIGIWQNEQTFDAINIRYSLLSRSSIELIGFNRVSRIFSRDAGSTLSPSDINYDMLNGQRPINRLGSHDVQAMYSAFKIQEWNHHQGKLFHFHYRNKERLALSNQTTGIDYSYRQKFGQILYQLESSLAHQTRQEIIGHPSAQFSKLRLAARLHSFEWDVLHTALKSHHTGVAFITPTASLHEHQGWADHFTTTPSEGIQDVSTGVSWRRSPFKLHLRYHQFSADLTSEKWGHEWSSDIFFTINKHHNLHLRVASFHSHEQSTHRFGDRLRTILTYSYKR